MERGAESTDDRALELALRSLRVRDVSHAMLDEKLERAGIDGDARRQVLERLVEIGIVDDARLARSRATSLASRGFGNAAIDARLAEAGIDRAERDAALSELEPEDGRALVAAGKEHDPRRVASLLSRRGFAAEAIEAALRDLDALDGAELP